jgi:ketopantoate reductase
VHIAVIGPGAVGSTIAAWETQSVSNNVVVAARSPLADIEVKSDFKSEVWRKLCVSSQVVSWNWCPNPAS